MKKRKLLAVLTATIMVLSGCSGAETGKTVQESQKAETSETSGVNDTIVFGLADNLPGVFNPIIASKSTDKDVAGLLYASLLEIDDKGELQPYLAESYELEGTKLSFKLRENVQWNDGTPVTAEDVAYTFECIMNPDFTGSCYSSYVTITGAEDYHNGTADHVEGIKVVDDYTVEFNFDKIYAPAFPEIATREILPKHIWEKVPVADFENQVDMMKEPIGCGPYKMEEYVEGQHVNLVANENFFLGEPKTKHLVIKLLSVDSILAEYRNGTIDIAGLKDVKTDEVNTIQNDFGMELTSFPAAGYQYIGINMRRDVFKDKALREALIYALDREQIVEKIVEGRATTLEAPFIPGGWADPDENTVVKRTYDLEKAKSLLSEAGYKDSDGNGILENLSGTELSFTYKVPSNQPVSQEIALIVQQAWKEIGVNIEIQSMEFMTVWEEAVGNHDFDFYTMGCQFDYDGDIEGWWHSSAATDEVGVISLNFDGFKNAELDDLIVKANETNDQNERKQYYNSAAAIISEEAPMIFMYVQDNVYAYPKGTEGFMPHTYNVFYNVHNWTIPEK